MPKVLLACGAECSDREVVRGFPSEADMAAVFPDGVYTFRFNQTGAGGAARPEDGPDSKLWDAGGSSQQVVLRQGGGGEMGYPRPYGIELSQGGRAVRPLAVAPLLGPLRTRRAPPPVR